VNWLRHRWPEAIAFLFDPLTLILITLLSGACCVASVVVTAWAVRRLPVDHLSRAPEDRQRAEQRQRSQLLRNALGFALLVLGLLMLVLPGQGLLTVVAALVLMDFRLKHRFERWLLLRPRVFAAINRFRRRSGQPPLRAPAAPE
jgi:hypothetical protein